MKIPTENIKQLRNITGAGIMECRNALVETEGDKDKALGILKERALLNVQKKSERATSEGVVTAYIHAGGRIGAMVELNCETDFVARTDEFKNLAYQVAMQIAAMSPQYVSDEDIPEGDDIEPDKACLLLQPYIRSLDTTIQDLINETIAKVGENIRINRFARFELGT
ncbi:elongation factor Ts [Chloroflexota bacterium]